MWAVLRPEPGTGVGVGRKVVTTAQVAGAFRPRGTNAPVLGKAAEAQGAGEAPGSDAALGPPTCTRSAVTHSPPP